MEGQQTNSKPEKVNYFKIVASKNKMDQTKKGQNATLCQPFLVVEAALLEGQQTNSTPEKTSMPQGSSMAKLLTFIPRS